MFKTSTQIIEEAVKEMTSQTSVRGIDGVAFLRSALLQAMKTAVEEVTPEEAEEVYHFDGVSYTENDDEVGGWNSCRSDMEEKKRKFFELR